MAWLDDRAWCHPKLVNLTDVAFRAYINSISYSAGMGLRGTLTPPQTRLVGGTKQVRKELVDNQLWNEGAEGVIHINDWDVHNGKRDERRAKDRERKRQQRKFQRQSEGTSAGTSAGQSALAARVEGSEGSENKEPSFLPSPPEDRKDGRIELKEVLKTMPA